MKTIAAAGLVLITAFISSPARAVPELLPYIYATTFCDLRSVGVDKYTAYREAIQRSMYDFGNQPIMVKYRNGIYASDEVMGHKAIKKTCPEYMR